MNLYVIVISLISTIIGMVGAFLFTLLRDKIQRKADSIAMRKNEYYIKRLNFYDEVINALDTMGRPVINILEMSDIEFQAKLLSDMHTLLAFSYRNCIFGSPNSGLVLYNLLVEMNKLFKIIDMQTGELPKGGSVKSSYKNLIVDALSEFAVCIRKEVDIRLIHEESIALFEKFDELKKELAKNGNCKN